MLLYYLVPQATQTHANTQSKLCLSHFYQKHDLFGLSSSRFLLFQSKWHKKYIPYFF